MNNYKLMIVVSLTVLLFAYCAGPRADEICGVDVSPYKPIDHTRWRTSDETLVAERVIFGYPPNHAFYMIMSFHHDGVWDSVVKHVSRPGIVVDLSTCKEQAEDQYNAEHEADAQTIDPEKTTRMQWEPGD